MTKVTILGQEPEQKKELKPIKFIKSVFFNMSGLRGNPRYEPNQMEEIKVIKRQGLLEFDIFFCKLKPEFIKCEASHCVYLGHFNDGVVE